MSAAAKSQGTYDAVVIGAGLNGLTAATVLARAGRKVIVLESRPTTGGLATGDEFHPGYHSSGMLHDTTGLLPEVVEKLNLGQHGLRRSKRPPSILSASHSGDGLLVHHDPDDAAKELNGTSTSDAESYARFRALVERIKPIARRLLANLPPDWMADGLMTDLPAMLFSGLALRRLGKADMMEVLRLPSMSVADWLDEQFENPVLKSTLAAPALRGYWGGPRSPGTSGSFFRYELLAGGAVSGGPQALVDALTDAARAAGVEIRTSTAVSKISVDDGHVSGVVCDDGQAVSAKLVLSSCDPKRTFFGLLDLRSLGSSLVQSIRGHRMRGLTAKVDLALNKPLRFRCRPELEVEFARTGESMVDLERTFDAAKYGRFVDEPTLDICVPSVSRPEAAPSGHSCVSVLVHGVPYELAGGWDAAVVAKLGDAVVTTLSAYVVDLEGSIVARKVHTPVNIEERYSVTGGHVYHGEHALDQLLVRPAKQCARYATPIAGLYLCGSGSHPGGGITCAPGFIAANTVLKSRHPK